MSSSTVYLHHNHFFPYVTDRQKVPEYPVLHVYLIISDSNNQVLKENESSIKKHFWKLLVKKERHKNKPSSRSQAE
jgi:hypothetical protein